MSKLKASAVLLAGAVAFVGAWEGLSLVAYRDSVGVPTICYGSTRGVRMGDRATRAECDAMFTADLIRHETGMRACMRRPDAIPDGAYLAFLSWTYNVGTGAACRSTLMRHVNAGNLRAACEELPRWNRAGGQVLRGLTNRRTSERAMCLEAVL